MAPEQFETGHYKTSVDIYALGLVIWEVFEEKEPFAGKTVPEIMMTKVIQKKGETLTEKTPENLLSLLGSCWSEASKRPTAEEILKFLENLPQELENKQALLEAAEKGDLETLKKLIAIEEKEPNYQLPPVLEAATVIFMHTYKTGGNIYTDDKLGPQYTVTRCREKVNQGKWPVEAGGLSAAGLRVDRSGLGVGGLGVAGFRKFH